jgi:hypothetical protein
MLGDVNSLCLFSRLALPSQGIVQHLVLIARLATIAIERHAGGGRRDRDEGDRRR